jgi:aminopeptidase N
VFTLDPALTKVHSRLEFQAWDNKVTPNMPLELDGEALELESIRLNGVTLNPAQYTLTDNSLSIHQAGLQGVLEMTVFNKPNQNTRLEGLYVSNGNFFNLLEAKDLDNGQHLTRWEDPFPKPAYLFALVSGDFVCQEETITKSNGKPALLQVWVEPGNLDKTDFAMQSLKKSIAWDQTRFGLDLDLDRFMIVATADFNMGAMENKGLNIFNTKFVFANPQLATDVDFENVESVVGHEYFHNWTGNRVTCQDWFQLSLKEGLTVFRDQEFSADMQAEGLNDAQAASARAVKRIEDVKVLRSTQFPEDAGPMAHPIRPDSYQEINNFYTVTVYEKGAEVIRMQHTLLGEQQFQRGMQIYFQRHDGQAATCEQFVCAMESALQEDNPNVSLKQFRNWYAYAGTPEVQASWVHTPSTGELHLTLKQRCKPTPGQVTKPAFHIPIRLGFVNPQGKDVPLQLKGPNQALRGDVLNLTEFEQTFVFTGLTENVVPSLLRGFSAPVMLSTAHTLNQYMFLAAHDNDPFNRWDAAQQVYSLAIREIYTQEGDTQGPAAQAALGMFNTLLSDQSLSDAYLALILQLPTEGTLFEALDGLVNPLALHMARCTLRDLFNTHFDAELRSLYARKHKAQAAYEYNTLAAGERALKNLVLSYLCSSGEPEDLALARAQFEQSNNMTDRFAALTSLIHNSTETVPELQHYFTQFEKEALAIDKWFSLQATVPASNTAVDTLSNIQTLLKHPAFTLKNPNRARSLLGALVMQNPSVFHNPQGHSYALWADLVIELNSINPQVAARMARALDRWSKLILPLQTHAKAQLERILAQPNLSPDVREIISKALDAKTII